jgi:hypothetical protein
VVGVHTPYESRGKGYIAELLLRASATSTTGDVVGAQSLTTVQK